MGTLLAVDGNSLVHRAFHARADTGFRTADGAPAWAVRGLLAQVCAAVERAGAGRVIVGFDDPHTSVRRRDFPEYKAHRPDKSPALAGQLVLAAEVMSELGCHVVVPAGLEADDVLASAARWGRREQVPTVLVTSDRDSFALIDDNTRVLRIINGGVQASPMLTPARLPLVVGVEPRHYPDLAAMRGDPSDNLPGITGVGPRTGARLLTAFGSAQGVFEAAAQGRCTAVVGPALQARLQDPQARARWEYNRRVMALRDDVPLSAGGPGRLPAPAGTVRRVCARFELPPGPALRALCGIEPATPHPADLDPSWVPPPDRPARRHPPLPARRPVPEPQLTLF